MNETTTFVLAYRSLTRERRTQSEQRLLTEAARMSQETCRSTADQPVLADLLAGYTDISLSFYDLCPVDSFERIN